MSAREFGDLLYAAAPDLGNHLWQTTAFAALAAGLVFALRRNEARVRYWVWMAASVKFLVPFAVLAVAAGHLAPRHVVAPEKADVYFAVNQVSEPFAPPAVLPQPYVPVVPPMHRGALALAAIWAVGFCTVLAIWCVRWRRVARVVAQAVPVDAGRELDALNRIAAAAGLRRGIEMRICRSAQEPGIFGVWRPVLLWPEAISSRLDDAQLDAVLAHELCHVRRRDNLTALLQMFVQAIFWFHPLVWWLGARLLAERERACDEEVVTLCPQPAIYAQSILKVCEFCVESPLACVSGVTGADLKRRVVDIMTARAVRRVTLGAKVAIAAAATLAVAVPVVLGTTRIDHLRNLDLDVEGAAARSMSQSSQAAPTVQDKPADLPAFEVATIKPEKSGSGVLMFNNTPDGIQVRGFTAQMLIRAAYGYDDDRISGGPNWIKSDPYDIEAKVAGADVPALSKMSTEQRRLMLQPLLAERFQLKVHRETQVRPIYQLIVAKSGLKLKPSSPAVAGEASQPKMQMGRTQLSAQRFPMTLLVQWLSLHAGRTVVDKTDAAGTYDFELQWSSDQGSGSASGGLEEPASAQGAYPSLFTALQEQLGLKLEPAKGPVETMVIDNIQKPELDGEGAPSGARVGYALEPVRLQNVAQTRDVSTASTAADAPTFAVSSVRPSGPDSPYRTVKFLPGGHFVAQGVTLRVLTKIAYDLNDDQLSGGPTWTAFKRFDIEAKPDPAAAERTKAMTGDQLKMYNRQLLQGLLSDRFKLKLRTETKDMPTYALVIGKSGPRLKPAQRVAGNPQITWRPGLITGQGASLDDLAKGLQEAVRHPVENLTALNGAYDFRLEWAPDQGMTATDPPDPAGQLNDAADSGPTLFSALQQQLGLRLDRRNTKAPYEAIESVELPAEN